MLQRAGQGHKMCEKSQKVAGGGSSRAGFWHAVRRGHAIIAKARRLGAG